MSGHPPPTAESLRVLHVIEAFGGGALEVVRLIAEGHARMGDSAAIAYGIRPETPTDVRAAIDARVELFATPWTNRTVGAQGATVGALRELTARWRPDVVHLHSSFAGAVGTIALRGRAPLAYTPHGYSFTIAAHSRGARAVYKQVERLVARRSDVVAAVSRSEGRMAAEVARAGRVEVILNGIPELDPGHEPTPRERPRAQVIAMGRIGAARRPEGCARILAAVSDLAEVSWVGGGEHEGERALEAAGVPVSGWVERSAATRRLAGATAYLHWAAWDGQPLSVLEAMAHDVVVVASDIEANREVLGDGQVCATEAEAVELLRAVLRDPGRREDMLASQRARRRAFGARRMVEHWRTLYEELARKRTAATADAVEA